MQYIKKYTSIYCNASLNSVIVHLTLILLLSWAHYTENTLMTEHFQAVRFTDGKEPTKPTVLNSTTEKQRPLLNGYIFPF